MKSLKLMLFGVFLVSISGWMAAVGGTSGSYLSGVSIIVALLGSLLFLVGYFKKIE